MPRSLTAVTPHKARGKSKGNRSIRCIPGGNEAIWDEELHAALIEALNIYPPMGRQRIRPMHDGSEGHTSLGRCQLIQQYLMQRTGKNRTRKQISSRIQRLRRMHQDDPAMADVLRVLPDIQQPISPEMLVNLNDGNDAAAVVPPRRVPATPPSIGSVESSACSSPSLHLVGDSDHSSASGASVQSDQLAFRLSEVANLPASASGDARIDVSTASSEQENMWPDAGLRIPDQPVPSLSRRRMTSDINIPDLSFQLDLPSGLQFSFPDSGCDFEASTMSVETGRSLSFAGNQFPYLSYHGHSADPITPVDQIIRTPEFPPQVLRCDKRSAHQSRCTEKDGIFSQPVTYVPSLGPCDPQPSPHLFATADYSSSKPSPFHTSRAQNYSFPSSPLASFPSGVHSLSSCLAPLGPEGYQGENQIQDITQLAQLPRRLSYPCDSRLLDSGLSLRMSPAAYSYVSEEGNMASTLGGLELASPAVIRPFFTSDFPCHVSGSSPHTPLEKVATAPVHDGSISR